MSTYPCLVCGAKVQENQIVEVFINPPDNSWETERSTPYLLTIAPCCGERECVEKAWEEIKQSTIGDIEVS